MATKADKDRATELLHDALFLPPQLAAQNTARAVALLNDLVIEETATADPKGGHA